MSLNESYHNSVAFSPNPHAPNLCTSVLRCFPMANLAAAADEPLSMETAEHFLRDQGSDVPQDLGGLRADEIVELLSAFCDLRTRGKSCIFKRDSRFLDPAQALPPKQQKLQMPPSITSAASGTPSRPMRLAPDSAVNRTLHLATTLNEVVLPHWSDPSFLPTSPSMACRRAVAFTVPRSICSASISM